MRADGRVSGCNPKAKPPRPKGAVERVVVVE